MARRLKALLGNLLLLVVSLLVAVAAVEIGLRLFPGLATEEVALRMHWQEVRDIRDADGARQVLDDPEIGFLARPGYRGEIRRGDLAFAYTTDAHGFRNPPDLDEHADIVVLGDSMAFGYGVEDDQGWVALLRRDLPGVAIADLGLIGAAPQQYRLIHERFGRPLGPQLVIFTLFPGNDINDAAVFDRWRREGGGMPFTDWRMEVAEPAGGGGMLGPWLERSYVSQLLREARRRLTTPFAGRTVDFADGSRVRLAPSAYAGNVRRADPANPDFQRVMATIQATRAEVEAEGADFLVLLMPTKELVYLPLLNEPVPDPLPLFKAELERAGVPLLDLTPALQAEAMQKPVYFEVDGHPNVEGYRLIAGAVAARLRAAPGRLDGELAAMPPARPAG